MKIVVDCQLAQNNPRSGMGIYVSEIVKELSKIDKKNELVCFSREEKPPQGFLSLAGEIFTKQVLFSNFVEENKVDVCYIPNPPVSLLVTKPVVLTIPDMSFWFDNTFSSPLKAFLLVRYFLSAHKAKIITTFSENSKEDIVRILKVNPKKIKIISPAVKDSFKKLAVRKKKSTELDHYFLVVAGTFIPRKNVEALLIAFDGLPKEIKEKYKIVAVGNNKDHHFQKFKDWCQEKNFLKYIEFTGYITEAKLVSLYKNAALSVFPSLYEGFGLPPLESMICGTSVIAYNNSSLKEIVGRSGVLVNNANELKVAIEKLLGDSAYKNGLIKKGRKQAGKYSYQRSAKELLQCLKQIQK